jgi:hypothetical protein
MDGISVIPSKVKLMPEDINWHYYLKGPGHEIVFYRIAFNVSKSL